MQHKIAVDNIIKIIEILKKTYPDAKCSLDFSTPFELGIAVMLSAQCTDERVNKTTPNIFKNYNEFIRRLYKIKKRLNLPGQTSRRIFKRKLKHGFQMKIGNT